MTKGGENQVFFVDDNARGYIEKYLNMRADNNPALFISDVNKLRMTPDNVQEVFKTLRKYTGLDVRPHVMRHSFGTDLMNNGADIRRVQELMHHKNIQTTAQYLHFVDGQLEEMHNEFHSKIGRSTPMARSLRSK
jgi:site-specific recombinase XerD